MTSLLLIRTGRTEYDTQGRLQGTLDVPLSEDGRLEIEQLGQELQHQKVDTLYAGPGEAARQTAEILSPILKQKVKTLDSLKNWNLGLWQGMLVNDVKSKQPKVYRQWQDHPESVCPPEGETLPAARERLQTVLAKLAKKHKEGTIALVVPEPLTTLIRNVLREDELGNLWQVSCKDSPAWNLIELPVQVASM